MFKEKDVSASTLANLINELATEVYTNGQLAEHPSILPIDARVKHTDNPLSPLHAYLALEENISSEFPLQLSNLFTNHLQGQTNMGLTEDLATFYAQRAIASIRAKPTFTDYEAAHVYGSFVELFKPYLQFKDEPKVNPRPKEKFSLAYLTGAVDDSLQSLYAHVDALIDSRDEVLPQELSDYHQNPQKNEKYLLELEHQIEQAYQNQQDPNNPMAIEVYQEGIKEFRKAVNYLDRHIQSPYESNEKPLFENPSEIEDFGRLTKYNEPITTGNVVHMSPNVADFEINVSTIEGYLMQMYNKKIA